MRLVERIVEVHRHLERASIPHAFGGALALAWCTQRARGTIDIDVNIFTPSHDAATALSALPEDVTITDRNRDQIALDGQTRLWWDQTPIDVFFNTTDFHNAAASRARIERFGGEEVPFLSCLDLAVFKAFFDRTKDWADLEEMAEAETLHADEVLGVLVRYLGGDDRRVEKLRRLT